MIAQLACPTADHERWKLVEAWWRDQRLIGYSVSPRTKAAYEMRNCSVCESTLARRCDRAEVVMEAPEGYWLSAEGYARLAEEMERAGHLDLLKYFERRTMDAAEARFDQVCAAAVPQLVAVDEVPEQSEPTVVIFAPNPWLEAAP